MSTREDTLSSDDTPSIHNSRTPAKSKGSITSWVAHFMAKCRISKPKLLENNHNTASNTSDKDDHHGGATTKAPLGCSLGEPSPVQPIQAQSSPSHPSLESIPPQPRVLAPSFEPGTLSDLICQDFDFMKEEIAKVKNYVDRLDGQINQAYQNFKELQTRGSRDRELHEVKKAVAKLKSRIPSQLIIHSADSITHRKWPDINNSSDEMMQLYMEPESERTMDSDLLEAFNDLPAFSQNLLLCFFLFPPTVVIKRRVIIYLWRSVFYVNRKDDPNEVLDRLIGMGFIELVYQKCSLVPDSLTMPFSVCFALSNKAMHCVSTLYNTGQIRAGFQSLINVDNAIIDGKLLEKGTEFRVLYLGRWQSAATHHIEVADNKVLHGLKNMKQLTFLSLRGISMITELPTFISKLTSLKILDLKACHNLEVVPDGIGSLTQLTHLDMSECTFLENMPRSLAKLSKLKVLKGFFIGDSKNNKRSCTLEDLSRLRQLRKLRIYTSMKNFPEEGQLSALQKFEALQNLTISWGRCSSTDGSNGIPEAQKLSSKPDLSLPPRLQKLDLQFFHWTSPPSWLRLSNMKELEELYIIGGGKLCNLDKSPERNASDPCTVKILCLKYLGDLKMDWEDLMILFPKLIFFHKVKCPELTNIPCNESGVWKRQEGH
ncbi:disease resistance RPP13-like protein 4 [Actinidia eriantha]|uniref:disease resistance RPP13-like protein 4 n=1 Tax=Actinidia eriantha TaxID=165200 RepID=UPI002589A600|nr:disease resistance RPP13-like protein 4 [Actinidia eriantha]XP_057511169.1 disease resistance RPP13-like protein 4 [Actinidia eriantha]